MIFDLLPTGDDKSKITTEDPRYWVQNPPAADVVALTTTCGGRGIRTHEERELLAVFKTAAIGH